MHATAQPSQRRLLIVDDHDDTLRLLVRLLSPWYEIATARCYDSALAMAEASPPDAVISDIGLPGPDGLVLMRELSRRYGVPGVAISGHHLDDDKLRDAGFVAHMLKPILFDRLLQILAETCAVARAVAR